MFKSCLLASLALSLPATALIFRDGASPAANTETAPTGDFADSGWQYQVRFGTFHGTMISPKHFITARHLGAAETQITQPMHFNGVEDRTYGIRPGSRRLIGTTDLAIFEIWETFENFAPLFTGSDEVGNETVISGRGFGRGTEFAGQGWRWGPTSTRLSRWGRNNIDGVTDSQGNDLLFFGFSDVLGQDEVAGTGGDSGGGWFIKDGPTWKLAAVSFSVDAGYSNGVPPSNATGVRGSFYDAGGLHIGSDANGWFLIPSFGSSNNPNFITFFRQSHTYGSRISSNLSGINPIINSALALDGLSSTDLFGAWLGGAGVTTGTGEADDADADGVSNLEEYLSDSDPADGSETRRPFEVNFLADGTHQFTLVESLDIAGRGLVTSIESSENLVTWATVTDASESSNLRDDAEGIRTRVLERTPAVSEALYYRLKISLP